MKAFRWRLGLAVVASAVASTGLVLIAEPALAVPGRVVVSTTTVTDSTSPKGGFLACPAGTVALGGGGSINAGAPGITIVQNNPSPAGWVFAAIEQGAGTAAVWSLTTWAVCAPAPAGYQIVQANGTVNPPASAIATCPAGKKVTGAGATLDTPVGDNVRVIEAIRPSASLTSVSARAVVDPGAIGGAASNIVIAYAVCINAQAGQQLVTATSPSNSLDKSVNALCPFPTVPHGVGATIRGGGGQVNLTMLNPSGNPAQVAAKEHSGGYAANWTLEAHAICLR